MDPSCSLNICIHTLFSLFYTVEVTLSFDSAYWLHSDVSAVIFEIGLFAA
jgi:hypothetical protein